MDWTWLAPVLSLLGALSGGLLAAWFSSRKEERRLIRDQVRAARIAVERLVAAQVGPDVIAYPGIDPEVIDSIRQERWRVFFDLYFDSNYEAKASLGTLRHLDTDLANLLDGLESWKVGQDELRTIRTALARIEEKFG